MKSFSVGKLACWIHSPTTPAPARVMIVHGLSEHSARHLNTVNALVSSGWEVVRFDLRGSGESGGERQWIEKFDDYVDDVTAVFNYLCVNEKPLPLYILGHSLGGAISIHFAARIPHEITGLMLSAPAFRVGSGISAAKIAVGRVLSRFVPHTRMPKSTDATAISRDPDVVEAYLNDPLCVPYNTLRQGDEILRALDEIPSVVGKLSMPVVIFHGSHDRVIKLEGSVEILRSLKSPEPALFVLPGGYHEPHNDLDKAEYFALLTAWLKKRAPSRAVKHDSAGLSAVDR